MSRGDNLEEALLLQEEIITTQGKLIKRLLDEVALHRALTKEEERYRRDPDSWDSISK